MSEWISIEVRKPPNDVAVLVNLFDGRSKVGMSFVQIATRYNNQWTDNHNGEVMLPKWGQVTHWMPLPDRIEFF